MRRKSPEAPNTLKREHVSSKDSFPNGFLWGAATSAHQVEGHQYNDWNEWEPDHAHDWMREAEQRSRHLPSWQRIKSEVRDPANYISGEAVDHYNRYPEDIEIMKSLGLNSYRFSIEWSRVEPRPGEFDSEAIEHYKQVLLTLREAGIEPFVTLHHFTNPVWLEDAGGWHGRDFPALFERYAGKVIQELGDLSAFWLTFNEPESYMISRYFNSPIWLWPGWPHQEFSLRRYFRARRQFIKAHKRAYTIMKRHYTQARVAYGHGIVWFEGENWWSGLLAKALDRNGGTGKYSKTKRYQDFLAVNYYLRVLIKIGFSFPFSWAKVPLGDKPSDNGWEIYPEGLYKLTQKLKKYSLPIYVTESGIADDRDELRADFIRSHVEVIDRSIRDGADIRGYFYWSLLDNYEWSNGFWPRFGLVEVDRTTQQRYIRDSAYAYRDIIQSTSG